MSFEIKQEERMGQPCLVFVGPIDEEAVFPSIDVGAKATIDLKQVSAINSVGIRAWILWFGNLEQTQFTFVNCPKALVMQMNMVEGFLPKDSVVASLEVPFYCEDCDEEKDVLLEVNKDIVVDAGQVKIQIDKSQICGAGCEPELDVSEVKYFRFLTQNQSKAA